MERLLLENIGEVVEKGLCVGCGVCAIVCHSKAIRIIRDETKGVYSPVVVKERCDKCGLCLTVCFGIKPYEMQLIKNNWEDSLVGAFLNCYVGHACDNKVRYYSSSGGIVTALSLFLLENGIVDGILATRMSGKNPLVPDPFIARTRSEVLLAAKSKYCPVPLGIGLKSIRNEKGKYALVGLPCHIFGARRAEALDPKLAAKITLHLGIFCAGTPNFLATDYILRRHRISKEQIIGIEYRGEGWPGSMTIKFRKQARGSIGQRNLRMPYPRYWEGIDHLFHFHRCTLCDDKFNTSADVSCGDAWLKEFQKDKLGTSLIITRNGAGEALVRSAFENGYIETRSVHNILKPIQAQRKVRMLQTRIQAQRALGKSLPPRYDSYLSINRHPYYRSLKNYSSSIVFNAMRFAASKRCLWPLIDLNLFMNRFIKRKSRGISYDA
jgi:coenzyme F420 hydrogenase subunit beta